MGRIGALGTKVYRPRKVVSVGSSGHQKPDILTALLINSPAEKDNI